ncbi:septation protein A [Curvivirga aplysinae]|uniref:septation protein A n=1 Tax=Curvivirga aplysinae TaxID=2529852 RepID=UPI0012BC9CE4|nr:septation protein A [Curvivirga aplysinae]MTI09589.1 septation protein A [Curvivirga aplysinae]
MSDHQNVTTENKEPKWVKTLVDYGPLVAFFITYWKTDDLIDATKVIMATTAAAIMISLIITRKLPIMPLVTAAVIGIFGGLTIYLNDETFIKMKPTIIQAAFALILGIGVLLKKVWLKHLFGGAMKMPDAAWRTLTIRFIGFFLFSAALNEIVWRTQSTDLWVNFKVFGLLILTFGFIATQMPFMSKHMIDDEDKGDA